MLWRGPKLRGLAIKRGQSFDFFNNFCKTPKFLSILWPNLQFVHFLALIFFDFGKKSAIFIGWCIHIGKPCPVLPSESNSYKGVKILHCELFKNMYISNLIVFKCDIYLWKTLKVVFILLSRNSSSSDIRGFILLANVYVFSPPFWSKDLFEILFIVNRQIDRIVSYKDS